MWLQRGRDPGQQGEMSDSPRTDYVNLIAENLNKRPACLPPCDPEMYSRSFKAPEASQLLPSDGQQNLAILRPIGLGFLNTSMGVRIRGTLGDIDPLNKVPFKGATSRVQKGPL